MHHSGGWQMVLSIAAVVLPIYIFSKTPTLIVELTCFCQPMKNRLATRLLILMQYMCVLSHKCMIWVCAGRVWRVWRCPALSCTKLWHLHSSKQLIFYAHWVKNANFLKWLLCVLILCRFKVDACLNNSKTTLPIHSLKNSCWLMPPLTPVRSCEIFYCISSKIKHIF